ncbi:MAG: tetratricopeptide repeat protein [Planctomycetota bacterium JB042]
MIRRAAPPALAALLLAVSGCSRDAAPDGAADPTRPAIEEDPYGPLPPDALEGLVTRVAAGSTDEGGTEDGPPPSLDRPYARRAPALEEARAAVRGAPTSRARRLDLARAYSAAGRYDLARAELGRLLRDAPRDAALHHAYGRELYYERFAVDEALRHLRAARALGLPPADAPDLLFLLGEIAEARDDPARAERFFAHVVKRQPNHAEAHYRIGALARARGDDAEAFERFQRVVRIDPRHVAALFGLGQLLVRRGATEEGERLLARHARLRRLEALGYADEPEAFQCIVLGNHEALAGAFDRALAEFDRALELEPEDPDARSYRAATLLDLGRVDDALAEWDRVLASAPAHAHALAGLGGFHLGSADDPRRSVDEALALARRAVKATGRGEARPLALLARALARSGDREAARRAIDEAIALEPEHGAWRALKADLEAGR